MNKKLTIITVCYNSENYIEETIKSVINQEYKNIEYIIIDGKSTDSTLDIIKNYCKLNKFIKYLSEEDNGIYDAMNKGIKLATGEYIFFLNSGDRLFDNKVLSDVSIMTEKNIDILYGNVVKTLNSKYEVVKYSPLYHLKMIIGRTICHQAMFVRRKNFIKYGNFDNNFKLASDFDFILRILKKNGRFKYIDRNIAYYDLSGISSKVENKSVLYNEYRNSISKNMGKIYCYILYKLKKRDK